MELPYHLKALPPEALDILRYYGTIESHSAHADTIVEGAGLTDRGFGRAIRRLVTRGYLAMDGDQIYRLTEHGKRTLDELSQYGDEAFEQAVDDEQGLDVPLIDEGRYVRRRAVMALPRALLPRQATHVLVGFEAADADNQLSQPANLRLRLSVLNADDAHAAPVEKAFLLDNRSARQAFEIAAGAYTQVRVRLELLQEAADGGVFESVGGMYVDLPVLTDAASADTSLTAFGVPVVIRETA